MLKGLPDKGADVSSVAFLGLAINNVLLYIDLGLLTGVDLALPRTIAGTAAMLVLVYGLVEDTGR